jgi:hypothetical protein
MKMKFKNAEERRKAIQKGEDNHQFKNGDIVYVKAIFVQQTNANECIVDLCSFGREKRGSLYTHFVGFSRKDIIKVEENEMD